MFNNSFAKTIKSNNTLPLGWKSDEAQNIYDISIGKTPPRTRLDCFTSSPNDVKWVSISDMGSNGSFILDTSEKLTRSAIKEFNVKLVPKDSVLYSFKMTNGRTAITTEECTTNEAIAHFKSENKTLVLYAYCYLKSFNFSDLGSTSSITEAVNSKIIKSMPFVIPPSEELERFISCIKPLLQQIKLNSFELVTLNNMANNYFSILSC